MGILEDIRSLKIQGASAVALAAVDFISYKLDHFKGSSKRELYRVISKARKDLIATRPTEPFMRNALRYIFTAGGKTFDEYVMSLKNKVERAKQNLRYANDLISEIGFHKIRKGSVIYTHCHSSTVVHILKKASDHGVRFTINNTETRPLYQGRKTAKELSRMGIPVRHFIDSAARIAIKQSDLVLLGCDAITTEGKVINKIGSEMIAEIAYRYDVPVYSCTHSWKFDPQTVFGMDEPIENRSRNEIWPNAPKKIEVYNPAFEMIRSGLVTGLITEIGIYRPEILVEEMKKRNSWIMQ